MSAAANISINEETGNKKTNHGKMSNTNQTNKSSYDYFIDPLGVLVFTFSGAYDDAVWKSSNIPVFTND